MTAHKIRIGIDLGGTKTEIIVLDDAGKTLLRNRQLTPKYNYHSIIKEIVQLVEFGEKKLGSAMNIGLGTPGTIEAQTGLMKNSNTTVLNGKPFKKDIEKALGRAISMANDANCFTLSEAIDGAAAGKSIVFGVIIGTGTGAGIAINQRLLTGANAIAGEWGHNPLPWPTQFETETASHCYCGLNGCIETWTSGPGFIRQANQINFLTPIDIVNAAENGNHDAEMLLQAYEKRLAKALASVINILDPDTIVLGGGMGNIERLYTNVPKYWSNFVFSQRIRTELVKPKYGDSSGVRGAAWLNEISQEQ